MSENLSHAVYEADRSACTPTIYHITNQHGDIAEATTDPDHARILALDLETQYGEAFTIEKVRGDRTLKRY